MGFLTFVGGESCDWLTACVAWRLKYLVLILIHFEMKVFTFVLDCHARVPQMTVSNTCIWKCDNYGICICIKYACLFSQVAAVALMTRHIQWAAGPGHGGLSPTYRSKNVHSSHSLLLLCLSAHNINNRSTADWRLYSPFMYLFSSLWVGIRINLRDTSQHAHVSLDRLL